MIKIGIILGLIATTLGQLVYNNNPSLTAPGQFAQGLPQLPQAFPTQQLQYTYPGQISQFYAYPGQQTTYLNPLQQYTEPSTYPYQYQYQQQQQQYQVPLPYNNYQYQSNLPVVLQPFNFQPQQYPLNYGGQIGYPIPQVPVIQQEIQPGVKIRTPVIKEVDVLNTISLSNMEAALLEMEKEGQIHGEEYYYGRSEIPGYERVSVPSASTIAEMPEIQKYQESQGSLYSRNPRFTTNYKPKILVGEVGVPIAPYLKPIRQGINQEGRPFTVNKRKHLEIYQYFK